jgi:hypothetical protein
MNPRAVVLCQCGKRLRVSPDLAGRRVKCPFCQAEFFVPKVASDPLAHVKSHASLVIPARKRPE